MQDLYWLGYSRISRLHNSDVPNASASEATIPLAATAGMRADVYAVTILASLGILPP